MPVSILIAHSLGLYASALVALLKELRPHYEIERLEPDELDDRVAEATAALVIADKLSEQTRSGAAAYILYYPDLTNVLEVGGYQPTCTIENPTWDALLSVSDSLATELVAPR